MSIHVEIVTPSAVAHEGDCEMAAAPGLMGEFGVLDFHAQTLAVTEAGVVTMKNGEDITQFVVGPGFAEVGPDRMTLLVDHCEAAGTVDKTEAKRQLDAAFAELKEHDSESEAGLQARKDADLARARLRA
jgi:F-type H+-transporting ATPase subunit epsilon